MTHSSLRLAVALIYLLPLYSPVAYPQEPPAAASESCANLSIGSLVKPVSFDNLAARLARIPAQKSEFETIKQFQARVDEVLKGLPQQYVLAASVVVDDSVPSESGLSYDAETQQMVVRPRLFIEDVGEFSDPENWGEQSVGVQIAEHDSPGGTFVGTTVMNAHFLVHRVYRTDQKVYDHHYWLSTTDQLDGKDTNPFSADGSDQTPLFTFSMLPERARAFKKRLKIYVVVNPKEPFVATHSRVIRATFDDPEELTIRTTWIVANVTCAVLVDESGRVAATRASVIQTLPESRWHTSEGLSTVGGRVSAPIPLFKPEAELSDEARRAKYQGVCMVGLIVDVKGNPRNVHILRSLGMGLDEKAMEAVRKYKFKPAMRDGKTPVPVYVNVEVPFRL